MAKSLEFLPCFSFLRPHTTCAQITTNITLSLGVQKLGGYIFIFYIRKLKPIKISIISKIKESEFWWNTNYFCLTVKLGLFSFYICIYILYLHFLFYILRVTPRGVHGLVLAGLRNNLGCWGSNPGQLQARALLLFYCFSPSQYLLQPQFIMFYEFCPHSF